MVADGGFPGNQDEVQQALFEHISRIEEMLTILVQREEVKEWYSVEEFARLVLCHSWSDG